VNFDDTARFFGPSNKLWPDLFTPTDRRVTKLCLDCRKRGVKARKRYCPNCARNRKRESKRKHMRRKRGSDVEKVANSPIGVEALTKPETQGGYHHPKTSILGSSFSTEQGIAQDTSEAHGSINTAEVA
jgi:hypothetical protein